MGALPLAKPSLPVTRILSLWQAGSNTNEIARALGLRECLVANVLARLRDRERQE